LDGQTLEAFLHARRGQGGLAPAAALALLRPIFDALAFAHEAGVAHRDIKPSNLMLVAGRHGTEAQLMDFGIAKLMGQDERAGRGATRTSATLQAYSTQYAAPEQVGATRTGPWTDVHALALILTEVLTDRPAYEGDDATRILGAALSP